MLLSKSGESESRLGAPSAAQSFAAFLRFSAAERARDVHTPARSSADESDAVHRELVRVYVAVDERRQRVALECPAVVCSLARLIAELLGNVRSPSHLTNKCVERPCAWNDSLRVRTRPNTPWQFN